MRSDQDLQLSQSEAPSLAPTITIDGPSVTTNALATLGRLGVGRQPTAVNESDADRRCPDLLIEDRLVPLWVFDATEVACRHEKGES